MVSRGRLFREVFRTWWARGITGGAIFIAFYQFACDQFGFPTLPNLWGMTGASAIPWWAWLLLAQLGFLFGLFEYVRRATAPVAASAPPSPPSPVPATTAPKPAPTPVTPVKADDRNRILETLSRARDSAAIAIHQGAAAHYERAFHEIEAAMLSVKRRFGIGLMKQAEVITKTMGRKATLQAYITYIDTFYPMLREGHSDAAKAKAAAFKWPASH